MRMKPGRWWWLLVAAAGAAQCDDPEGEGSSPEPREQAPAQGTEASEDRGSESIEPPEAAEDPWAEQSDAELEQEIEAALKRAGRQDKRVLLEFIAPWCTDCREVVRLGAEEPAARVIESEYERVFVNVGRFDRHEALREKHEVDRITTLVVLSPEGERLARTTLEPISKDQDLTPAKLAAWLRNPSDGSSAGSTTP